MKKTISLNVIHLKNLIFSFFLGFLILFALEHKNEIGFYADTKDRYDQEQFSWKRKVFMDDEVGNFEFKSYLDNKIIIGGNGYKVGDLYDEDSDFNTYRFKLYFYLEALKKDIRLGFYISLTIFLLLTFLVFYKIKMK